MENTLNTFTTEQLEQLLKYMQEQEAQKNNATINNIFGKENELTDTQSNETKRDSKVLKYRKQVEYGPKKFIKP